MNRKEQFIVSSVRLSASQKFFLFVVFFLVVFPKGGVTLGDIPFTWSYALLALAGMLLLPLNIGGFFSGIGSLRFGLIAGFPLYAGLLLWANGSYSFGLGLAFFVSSVGMPLLLFIFGPVFLLKVPPLVLTRYLRWLLGFVSAYGLLAFVLHNYFSITLFVPYLTTGVVQVEDLMTKHNMRGEVSKLISTYNNGNIFGVCLLILLPLADVGRTARSWMYVLLTRSALIFTLSRTVWVGLILYELLSAGYVRKVRAGFALLVILIGGGITAVFMGVLTIAGYDSSFLIDTTMGGRLGVDSIPVAIEWVSDQPFGGIREIVYMGVAESFGIIGLLLFIPHFFAPWLIVLFSGHRPNTPLAKSCLLSVLIYNILSLSDGAYLLIPVAAFYWFMAGYLYVAMNLTITHPAYGNRGYIRQSAQETGGENS